MYTYLDCGKSFIFIVGLVTNEIQIFNTLLPPSRPANHSLAGQVLCLETLEQDGDLRLISGSNDKRILVSRRPHLDVEPILARNPLQITRRTTANCDVMVDCRCGIWVTFATCCKRS